MTRLALGVSEEVVIHAVLEESQNKLTCYNDMRKKGILCDCVFIITKEAASNRKIFAHKVIIFKTSTFCADMILKEGTSKKIPLEITVDNISKETVEKIISYMYTGELSIKLSDVEECYVAAQLFKLIGVQDQCVKLLCTNVLVKPLMLQKRPTKIDKQNSVTLCQLWLEVEKYLFDNFNRLMKSPDFQDIPNNHFKNLMLAFINREERPSDTLTTLFCQALAKWGKKDFVKRHPIIVWLVKKFEDNPEQSLLAEVERLCGEEDLIIDTESQEEEFVDMTEESNGIVEDVSMEVISTSTIVPMEVTGVEDEKKESMEPAQKRVCFDESLIDPSNLTFEQANILFVEVQFMGGENGSQRNLWTFDFKDKKFSKLVAMPSSPVSQEQIVVTGSMVYVIGGVHHSTVSSQVQVLNLRACPKQWKTAPAMQSGRKEFATAVYKDYIFVIGGSNSKSAKGALNSVERLDVKKEGAKWEFVTPMEDARVAASASVLNGFIFVVGGRKVKDTAKISWKSVEMYDIRSNVWTKVSNMWVPRSGCSTVSLSDNLLYVFGGENNEGLQNSVEMYDLTKDLWSFVASLKQKRRFSSAVRIGGRMFVFGGYDAKSVRISSAEVFDPNIGLWEQFINPCDDLVTTSFRTVALIDKTILLL